MSRRAYAFSLAPTETVLEIISAAAVPLSLLRKMSSRAEIILVSAELSSRGTSSSYLSRGIFSSTISLAIVRRSQHSCRVMPHASSLRSREVELAMPLGISSLSQRASVACSYMLLSMKVGMTSMKYLIVSLALPAVVRCS